MNPSPHGLATRLWHALRRRCLALPSLQPTSRKFGFDRGQPIDRYYIADFLKTHAADVRGRVLEVGDNEYTRAFGGSQVTHSDVLNTAPAPGATVVADLTQPGSVPSATYDCFIMTQTLPYIFDVRAALRTTHDLLRPGGVLLATVSGISQISRYEADRWGDFWRFTPQSLRRLLEERFAPSGVTLRIYGNVRAAAAFLDGRAAHELRRADLDYVDEDYPVTLAARAVRHATPDRPASEERPTPASGR